MWPAQLSSVHQLVVVIRVTQTTANKEAPKQHAVHRRDATSGKTITLAGPKAWTVEEVIALCEKYADSEADVSIFLQSKFATSPIAIDQLCPET